MTEGEVCLDYAKMAETQRQTQLGHASAVKKALFKRKRNLWFKDEGRLAIIGAEFKSHLGNVGLMVLMPERNAGKANSPVIRRTISRYSGVPAHTDITP